MITRSKQNWTVGSRVKVGFLNLIVKAAIETPGDSAPDAYILQNISGTKLYKFVPHNGIVVITTHEARELLVHQEQLAWIRKQREEKQERAAQEIKAVFADHAPRGWDQIEGGTVQEQEIHARQLFVMIRA